MAIPKTPGGEMPFLDHLEELRWRIIYSLIALMLGLAIGLYFSFKFNLIDVIQQPMLPYMGGRKLVITRPMDAFNIRIQIAFVIGLAFAAPVIGYQLWAFLSPALHKSEKKVVIPSLIAGAVLFLSGMALAWFLVLPITLQFLNGLIGETFETMYVASEYFSFATNLGLAFGVAFEVPLLLVALVGLGILSASTLNKSRKYAVVVIWVVAAIVSPGDAVTATVALAVPLYFLYEVSIVVSFFIERKRRKRKAIEAAAELSDTSGR